MRPTRLLPGPSTSNLATALNAAIVCYCNYEMYRVYRGTHPYFSPKLEAAGILPRPPAHATKPTDKKPAVDALDKEEMGWTRLNGVPIPSLEMLMRPFRR